MKLAYRDDNHAYFLDGRRVKSITTVAKVGDDTYALDQWRKRMIVAGFAARPELLTQASNAGDDRDELERVGEAALAAAKAHSAAETGTAMHGYTEAYDLGTELLDTPLARATRRAWEKALEAAGLSVIPDLIERIVVWPTQRIAGRFDRIMQKKGQSSRVIVDLKTGANAPKYPHAIAVQLALYANAPLLAGPLPPAGGTTEEFGKLPELDLKWGFIVHMPPGGDEVSVHKVDIEAGMERARENFKTLKWRAKTTLCKPVASVDVEIADGPATETMTSKITDLLDDIGKFTDEARTLTAAMWPAGVSYGPPWTAEQAEQLVTVLRRVAADTGLPF